MKVHPVVITGSIAFKLFRLGNKLFGIFLWFISVVPIIIIYYIISRALIMFNIIIGIIVYAYFLKLTFSIRLMRIMPRKY